MRIAAALHDVGKVAIPDAILNKPGPLDDEDWAFVRRHTLIGETIMQAAPALRAAARLVRSSHERFDGRGYPDSLAGERSRSARGSSSSATRSMRCSRGGRTRRRCRSRTRSRS